MLFYYLKLALRNILRGRAYNLIHILGLSIALTCAIFISLWIYDEISYDRFHEHSSRITRVLCELHRKEISYVPILPGAVGPLLQEQFPEIEKQTRILNWSDQVVHYQEETFVEDNILAVDPSFFEIFTLHYVYGSLRTNFPDPYSVIITEDISQKYFGDQNPIGKIIGIGNDNHLTVAGVVEAFPANSHFHFDFLVPMDFPDNYEDWYRYQLYTYVLLREGEDISALNEKIGDLIMQNTPEAPSTTKIFLQPLQDIHLFSDFLRFDTHVSGNIQNVYLFGSVALLILAIACINFINISMAYATRRAKEVGIRKVTGAKQREIFAQFFIETVCLTFLSLVVGIVFTELFFPLFNQMTGKEMSMALVLNPWIIGTLCLLFMFTSLAAGLYPALILAGFQPIQVLHGGFSNAKQSVFFRKILVIIQFFIAVSLMICSLVVLRQVHYMERKPLGFQCQNIYFWQFTESACEVYSELREDWLQQPFIKKVGIASSLPMQIRSSTIFNEWVGKDSEEVVEIKWLAADSDFFDLFAFDFLYGEPFPEDESANDVHYVVNEMTLWATGMHPEVTGENPIGKKFQLWDIEGKIGGVVKDFHLLPLQQAIMPLAILPMPSLARVLFVEILPQNDAQAMAFLKDSWAKWFHNAPLDVHDFSLFAQQNFYGKEQRMNSIFQAFTWIAVFISCLGLFGLISFIAEKRTKEIGIRKALGASAKEIVFLLVHEFIGAVFWANVLAWPLAYVLMRHWLGKFAYRIQLDWFSFLLAAVISFVIAFLTVSYQAMKTARIQPAQSLRYE